MKLGNAIAHTFSIVFHPLLITFYSIAALYAYTSFYDVYSHDVLRIFITVILFSAVIPAAFLILLKKLGFIKSYALIDKEERFFPYLMAFFSNSMLIYYFYTSNMYFWFLGLIAAPTLSIFAGFIINLFWKISAHMLGIGSFIGGMFSICFNVKGLNPFILFIILIIFAGCLGVSRLHLKRNTPAQVYAGFIIGFVISFATVWFSIMLIG